MRHAMQGQRAQKHTAEPAWMQHAVPCEPGGRPQRPIEPAAHIVLAVGADRNIHSEYECFKTGARDALNELRDCIRLAR